MKLQNPVASLISLPLQLNYDQGIGPGDKGERVTLNVQPVIPFSMNDDWNLISRTILPIVTQSDVPVGNDETGIGDVLQTIFFSPKDPTASGWIWGAGPVLLLPTATDDVLGQEKWGLGPSAVALRQDGPWTYGALGNHIWSVAGDSNRTEVNATFFQPFLSYTTETATTFSLNSESLYDWRRDEASVPLNATVGKVVNLGGQAVSLAAGLRYWVHPTDTGPEGLGARFVVTLLFPR